MEQTCKCGCGEIVTPGHLYIWGHYWRGRKRTKENLERISKILKGKIPWNKGKKHSEETLKRISKALTGRKISREWKRKISMTLKGRFSPNKGNKYSTELRKRLSEMRKKENLSMETRKKMSEIKKGKKHKPESIAKMRRKKVSKIAKQKIKIASLKRFKDKTFLAKWAQSMKARPNKPEKILLTLLSEMFQNEWKYVGDFKLWIDGKNPDFVNVNGQKKLIELFGDYWHRNDNEQDRINHFKRYGFDTLIVWERELAELDKLQDKLLDFHLR